MAYQPGDITAAKPEMKLRLDYISLALQLNFNDSPSTPFNAVQ